MNKNWPRGLLLGVSMALLLSGGVALAAPRTSIDPWCGVCCQMSFPDLNVEQDRLDCDPFWSISTTGWGANEDLDLTLTPPGTTAPLFTRSHPADGTGRYDVHLHFVCWREGNIFDTLLVGEKGLYLFRKWQADDYGKWTLLSEGESGAVEADFYFAEDAGVCRAMEFVPESGSILLLGSGLAGLAGYAALRWRTRE